MSICYLIEMKSEHPPFIWHLFSINLQFSIIGKWNLIRNSILRNKWVKCHDSSLYSCVSLDPHISVTGDEDGFVKMWDSREDSGTSIRIHDLQEVSFLKMDDNHSEFWSPHPEAWHPVRGVRVWAELHGHGQKRDQALCRQRGGVPLPVQVSLNVLIFKLMTLNHML